MLFPTHNSCQDFKYKTLFKFNVKHITKIIFQFYKLVKATFNFKTDNIISKNKH